MAGFIGGRTSAFDYIGPELPNNPQNGEMWFDTDGASDGTGEVKVYDGSNDEWEATGFTSHADLTDVTRSAHHPPVEVSGPLTQPADQSLGLSIGDGLADSGGTLVAALGNGLGVDANGQVYVPAGALSHGAEVDAPADAHHTRYSDAEASAAAPVQTVNGQTGDVSVSQPTQADAVSLSWHGPITQTVSYSGVGDPTTTTYSIGEYGKAFRVTLYTSDTNLNGVTVNYAQGMSWSFSASGGEKVQFPSGKVDTVEVTTKRSFDATQTSDVGLEILTGGERSQHLS